MRENIIPEEFINRWERFYGTSRTKTIVTNLKQTDPRFIVHNSLKTELNYLKSQLEKKGFEFEKVKDFNGLFVKFEPFNIVSTPEYLAGMFSIQAISSLIPPLSINPSPNNIVVDLTASPGIKTCLLAQQMTNQGTIIAIEISKQRIPALKSNVARMGVTNTIIFNFDALLFPKLDITVDYILLDAPCSGSGLSLSKNKRLEPRILDDIPRQSQRQKDLLEAAWRQLNPEGTLVYSTCSLEPEEGEVQISNFLEQHEEEVFLLPIPFNIGMPGNKTNWTHSLHPQLSKTKRIFPKQGYDGFFTALLKKVIL
ncbi:MAG: RsmB/NOP family class I SAM-dependent RNA methyltransferase [Candidatus Heimdallarchaeota archaeon]|nr:MAG: RsmB/NOP family class I SAM-dependent RNA methyltransferase [Candidatus Heimdallarchaeota archaeon]